MLNREVKVYIGLGSNVGNRHHYIERALSLIAETADIRVLKESSLLETRPVGGPPQGDYLNGAAEILTCLEPEDLLEKLQSIENIYGRTRDIRWGPRTVDLDILLYGDRIIERENLIIPHPRMAQRLFVLEPLSEIAPEAWHPGLKKTVSEILNEKA